MNGFRLIDFVVWMLPIVPVALALRFYDRPIEKKLLVAACLPVVVTVVMLLVSRLGATRFIGVSFAFVSMSSVLLLFFEAALVAARAVKRLPVRPLALPFLLTVLPVPVSFLTVASGPGQGQPRDISSPVPPPPPGGVYGAKIVPLDELPCDVREALIKSGVQNVVPCAPGSTQIPNAR